MDDEINDMFFSPFSAEDNQNCKKGRLHRFFRIFAVRGVRLTFSCELLSESYLCVHYCLAL